MSQPGWGPGPPAWRPPDRAPLEPRSNRGCWIVVALLGGGFVIALGAIVVALLYWRSHVGEVASSSPTETPIEDPPSEAPTLAPEEPPPRSSDPRVPVKVETVRYEVAGATAAELRADLNQKGPLDASGRHDAMTTWRVDWRFPRDTAHGGCATGPVHVEVKITYRLPSFRPTARASADLLARWHQYEQNLLKHEQGHAAHGIAAGEEVARELSKLPESPTCPILDAAVERRAEAVLDKHRAEDLAYDATTRHGATQGAVFP